MLELLLPSVGGLLIGGVSVWLYYRSKFTEVLTELADKKLIIKTIHSHADQIERVNIKKIGKAQNAKVAKKEKVVKKTAETSKRKYKKQSV